METFDEYREQVLERKNREEHFMRAYGKGWRNGYDDFRMRATIELWDYVTSLDDLDPDLSKLLKVAIDKIEKLV